MKQNQIPQPSMAYHPANGELFVRAQNPEEFRGTVGGEWLYDPWMGRARKPADVINDPEGRLIWYSHWGPMAPAGTWFPWPENEGCPITSPSGEFEVFYDMVKRRFVRAKAPASSDGVSDPVNHPKHYTSHPSGVECITVTEHMRFNVGNAVKYLWRADEKEDALQDLRKAQWYVTREIERREKLTKNK